jgi:hypothetical protein
MTRQETFLTKLWAGIAGILVMSAFLGACNKKNDPKLTSAGGGVSSQSVVTLKGAAQ